MRTLTCLAFCIGAALLMPVAAFGAPPTLVTPSPGANFGGGAAIVDVKVTTSTSGKGAEWGWRIVASTDPSVVANPWPFAQLDYAELNSELQAISRSYSGRGLGRSGLVAEAQDRAKVRFFQTGFLTDLRRKPDAIGSGVDVRARPVTETTTQLILDRPGTWYIAVAAATEQQIEWSTPVTVTVEPAPARPVPAPVPAPQPAPAVPVVSTPKPVAKKPVAKRASARCRTATARLNQNTRQLRSARAAVKKAKTVRAQKVTRAKVQRLVSTRVRIVAVKQRAC